MLTIHDKRMLKKLGPELKTDEKAQLKKLFNELPCFDEISPVRNCKMFREIYLKYYLNFIEIWKLLREKLVGAVEFQYFEKERTIILEDHPAMAAYFIVNGEVFQF